MPRPLSMTVSQPSGSSVDLDEGRVAGDRLVHGIVEHLGEEVVHRGLVGAADIHAGAPAHGLQPLQHFDRGGGVFRRLARLAGGGRRALARRAAEKIIAVGHAGDLSAIRGARTSRAHGRLRLARACGTRPAFPVAAAASAHDPTRAAVAQW